MKHAPTKREREGGGEKGRERERELAFSQIDLTFINHEKLRSTNEIFPKCPKRSNLHYQEVSISNAINQILNPSWHEHCCVFLLVLVLVVLVLVLIVAVVIFFLYFCCLSCLSFPDLNTLAKWQWTLPVLQASLMNNIYTLILSNRKQVFMINFTSRLGEPRRNVVEKQTSAGVLSDCRFVVFIAFCAQFVCPETPKAVNITASALSVSLHDQATLSCFFEGLNISPLTSFWLVPGMNGPVTAGSGSSTSSQQFSVTQTAYSANVVRTLLTVTRFTPSLVGQYSCGATNTAGDFRAIARIGIQLETNGIGRCCLNYLRFASHAPCHAHVCTFLCNLHAFMTCRLT